MININNIEYWDNRFKSSNGITDWELCQGCKQTINFMESIINNISDEIRLKMNDSSILDYGCALGDGCKMLFDFFGNNRITGYDFSENAVNLAKYKYPELKFKNEINFEIELYDFVICSNVLQCADDYIELLNKLISISNKALIIMVPFGSYGTTIEHYNQFQFSSFPKEINYFYRRKINTIDVDGWAYKQMLVRYERI